MPSVAVHPQSPVLGGFDSNMTVADIKSRAKDTVMKEAGRASALSSIRTARNLLLAAKEKENNGELHSALENYIKAATLVKLTLDSNEFRQETLKGNGGVVRKEFNDFMQNSADLSKRTQAIESKLKALEAAKKPESTESQTNQSYGSIADRVRALQNNGLEVGPVPTIKPTPHLPGLSNTPLTPTRVSPISTHPSPSSAPLSITPTASTSSTHHTFVSPSSLGPPSPGSSPATSPNYSNTFDISGFNTAFPSIDELEGSPAFTLPSVPTGTGGIPSKPSLKDIRNSNVPPSPSTNFRNFALHIDRPSSTPITPTSNAFNSRPGSPSRPNGTTPLKPSGLSSSTVQPKTPIPNTNTVSPKDLSKYMKEWRVLLIDIRHRADFDREHIHGEAVVCIEPTVIMRGTVSAQKLEDSMVIGPKHEASIFSNRDKFDLVAIYDESATSFDKDSPQTVIVREIYEQAFNKPLKRMPMLLIGGIKAWKKDLGGSELIHGKGYNSESSNKKLSPPSSSATTGGFVTPLSPIPISPKNPFNVNGLVTQPLIGSPPSLETSSKDKNPFRLSTVPNGVVNGQHRPSFSIDQTPSRSPEINYTGTPALQRRSALPSRQSISQSRSEYNGTTSPPTTYNSFPPITYPTAAATSSASSSHNHNHNHNYNPNTNIFSTPFISPPDITSPPIASINPSWKRTDYIDQSQEALFISSRPTGSGSVSVTGTGIDYPDVKVTLPRPPPVATSTPLERQDSRPPPLPLKPSGSGTGYLNSYTGGAPQAPRILSDYPVTYWGDIEIGLSGLKNLGNTCYMNAPIQCLSATAPFARFFNEHRWKSAINYTNPFGSKGKLTTALAKLLHEMWGGDLPYLTPHEFRKSICQLRSQYDNSDQHDSQEFLSFLMDGIHEDLNRVIVKPPPRLYTKQEEEELEKLPPQIASEREWKEWKVRNDSLIVDYFQGQFRSKLECLSCGQTSTTYNVFSVLQLPIPTQWRGGKVSISKCLDALFGQEILEKDDSWDCPRCKTKRRATKSLGLARLPPVLLIHLKRFEASGRFSDKVDSFVDFPMKGLDLTSYMPTPLPLGADRSELNGGLPMSLEDPRTQMPPYKYDLYAVTNHYGNLTSGHYTSFIASRGGWMYCDDSSIKPVEPKQVVNQKAYVLFYKKVRS